MRFDLQEAIFVVLNEPINFLRIWKI